MSDKVGAQKEAEKKRQCNLSLNNYINDKQSFFSFCIGDIEKAYNMQDEV